MRIGELGYLTWGDIDFTNKIIYISKLYTCDYSLVSRRARLHLLKQKTLIVKSHSSEKLLNYF
jgi:integrase